MRRYGLPALALVTVLHAAPASAADSATDLLPVLLDRLTAPLGLPPGPTPPELQQVQRAIRVPFIASPESPTHSFSFRFDPAVGAFVPTGSGFGSLYAVRPDTLGRGHFSVGVTYSRADFEEIDGARLHRLRISLGDGLVANVRVDALFEGFDLKATVGILDDLDIDIALPIIHQYFEVRGSLDTPFGTTTARTTRDITGVGDIVLGAKYRILNQETFGLAARLDLSLPSGSEDDFIGQGFVGVNPSIIASVKLPYQIRLNGSAGFRLSTDTDKREHQFFYRAGFEWPPIAAFSIAVDFLATHVIDNGRPALKETSGVGFSLPRSSSNIFDIGITLKGNPWRNVVLVGGVTVPLNRTGIRAPVIPSVGVEVSF